MIQVCACSHRADIPRRSMSRTSVRLSTQLWCVSVWHWKAMRLIFFNKVSDAAMSQKINNSFKNSVKTLAATCKTLSHLSWNISGDILLSRNTPASQLAWCKTSDLVLYGCIQIMKGVHQVVYNYRKYQTGTVAFSLWAQHSSPHTHTSSSMFELIILEYVVV